MNQSLFSPLPLGRLELNNRIVVAPMCQYSADDGSATDWHLQHLMQLAYSGAGMVTIEATAVERRGRITHGCLGLYSDANEAALERVLNAARRVALPGTVWGIQLAHAGRKASAQRPWEGGRALSAQEDSWPTVAPSAVAFGDGWHRPEALDEAGMDQIEAAFVQAARRAARLGIDVIELHCAHGYLMHEFLSPLVNQRRDQYGGALENRMRFPLRIARAVMDAVGEKVVIGARITGTDWVDGGFSPEDAVTFANELKALGLAYVCVSSGGAVPHARIPVEPGYQVHLAERVRRETGMTTRAVGLIASAEQANQIVARGQADLIALARAFLDDPRWGWHAAEKLGQSIPLPPQYERAGAARWPGYSLARD